MKILIKIIKTILLISLTIMISLLIFTNLATSTILNKYYAIENFEKADYYAKIKEEIKSNFENYISQSGFDENIMNDIVSDEKIKNDTETIISNIYDGTDVSIDTTEIEEKLRSNIENSLGKNTLNVTQKNAINQYVETICNQYKKSMSHTNYEKNINNIISKLQKYSNIAKKGTLIATSVLIILIIISNYKNILKGISQIGISIMSSGLLYIIANLFIHSKIKISNLLILNTAASDVLKLIANNILDIILKDGIILLVIGTIMILISNLIIGKKESKEKDNK